jgi:predicted porin
VQEMKNRAGTEERRIVGLGGNVRVNAILALYSGYMARSSKVSPQENKVWALGANIEVAQPVTLTLQYFHDKQTGSAALDGSRKVAWVSANYKFSRRTDVYVAVDHNKVEGGYTRPAFMAALGGQTALSAGLRTRF